MLDEGVSRRLISGRKPRNLGGKSGVTGAAAAARQRNLKQKFVSLLKKFKVTDPEELDHEQANLDQKLSGEREKYNKCNFFFIYIQINTQRARKCKKV